MTDKEKLLEKFIEVLPFEGWNADALEHASKNCGFPDNYSRVLYPGGIREFTEEFANNSNKVALEEAKNYGFESMKISQKAEELIFQKVKSYHESLKSFEALKKFVSYAISPQLIGTAARGVFAFSDESWRAMGDKSTDFSFYTRRASFAAIYTKSMLYSLDDNSENLVKTRNYIKKSIDGLMKFHKLKGRASEYFGKLKNVIKR